MTSHCMDCGAAHGELHHRNCASFERDPLPQRPEPVRQFVRGKVLFVPYLAHSTNVAIRAHHQERRRQVKDAAWACKAACQGMAPIVGRVDLVFRPRLGKGVPRRDTSNYSINVKHVEDGLVAAGMLPDDRGEYVRRVIMEPPEIDRKGETGTWVEIIKIEGEA